MSLKGTPIRFERPQPVSVADGIYDFLRDNILAGSLEPGSRITEAAFAKRLGVSRTPLREALHKLELEGLVVALPDGLYVQHMTHKVFQEIFELRCCLEGFAASLAAKKILDAELRTLQTLHEEAVEATKADISIQELVDTNSQFHTIIYAAAHNDRLNQQIDLYRGYWFNREVVAYYSPTQLSRSMEDHARILAALRERDPVAAERLVRRHIESAYEVAIQRFENLTASQPPQSVTVGGLDE